MAASLTARLLEATVANCEAGWACSYRGAAVLPDDGMDGARECISAYAMGLQVLAKAEGHAPRWWINRMSKVGA